MKPGHSNNFRTKSDLIIDNLVTAGYEHPLEVNPNYHPLSENCDFSKTEPPMDLRPVCKL